MRGILGTWSRVVLTLCAIVVLGTFALFAVADTSQGIDPACIARIRRPEEPQSEVKIPKGDLKRLSGTYMETEMGFVIKMEPVENRLRATVLKGIPFPPSELIPISPTCFRWEGKDLAPGLTAVFHLDEKSTELTIVQPGKPEVVMKRTPGSK